MNYVTYIGCYTDEKKEGIHILETNAETGAFQKIGGVTGIENAIYLTLAKKRPLLYAGLGRPEYGEKAVNGCVAAYAIQGDTLSPINHRSIGVTAPCYVALDPSEQALVFAEYTNAVAGVFELAADGSLSDRPPLTVTHTGHGPNPQRQEKAHAHCAEVTPDGKHLCVVDLGIDRVKIYDFAHRKDGLRENERLTFSSAPGAGPRHILFHPNGRLVFLLHELDNTLSSFVYTGEAFVHVQTRPTLPPDFHAYSKASAVKLSADGTRVLASNRGHDSIAVFATDPATGEMDLLAISKMEGQSPRDFELMPGERFLLAGHENSNALMSYAFDRVSGKLTSASDPLPMYRPVYVKFGARRA